MVLVAHFLLGLACFFFLSVALSDQHIRGISATAAVGLVANFVVCLLIGRRHPQAGISASLWFSAPAVLFLIGAFGDALYHEHPWSVIVWSAAAAASIVAGLLGGCIGYLVARKPVRGNGGSRRA